MKRLLEKDLIAAALVRALAFTSAHGQQVGGAKPATVPDFIPGLLMGYLPKEALPNSLALLPPPPAEGSPAFALDQEVAQKNSALRGKPRWTLAAVDADLSFPNAAGTFSCALNAPVTEELTPHLYQLLRRTLTDVGLSTYAAKNHYQRTRPFVMRKEPVCTPADRADLEKDGSYPSGHAAVGWGWALTLSEIAPDRTDALLARGAAYGESRNVCNVHWHSDVVEGRVMAAGTVARLHAEPAFRADLAAAKAEVAAVRAQSLKPTRDCTGESAALAR
jgi:acid phosphatase (class A)